jgi:cell division protein FtsW
MANKGQTTSGYDLFMLIPTLLLITLGLVAIYSASSFVAAEKMKDSYFFLKKQAFFCLLGIVIMVVVKNISPKFFRALAYPLLLLSFSLLVLLLIPGLGTTVGGACRWLHLAGFSLQPSEFTKLSLVIYMAYSMAKKGKEMSSFSKGFLPHFFVIGCFVLLIMLQPDLGTTVLIGGWFFIMLFIGGLRPIYLLTTIVLSVPAVVWLIVKANYRLNRWMAFLNPWEDPQGLGFQIIHSFLAIGSGGIFGVGLGNSMQKLHYLPEPHTDFILSILAEEFGFMGLSAVVILFSILILRGIMIALDAKDLYSSYLAMGIITLFSLQVLVNMGVVLGLLPTKGLTLPLISYGGSSLLMNLLGIGILMSISARR